MRVAIVRNYENLTIDLSDLIDAFGYSYNDLASQVGLSLADFITKIDRNSFSADELKTLVCLLGEENIESYLMIKIMDTRTGESTVSLVELKTQMRWN